MWCFTNLTIKGQLNLVDHQHFNRTECIPKNIIKENWSGSPFQNMKHSHLNPHSWKRP